MQNVPDPPRLKFLATPLDLSAVVIWLAAILAMPLPASHSQAAPSRRSVRSLIAKQEALLRQQRERTIAALRQEVSAAKQVLQELNASEEQTASGLKSSAARLSTARRDVESAEQADNDLHRRLREIESRVLSAQNPQTEYGLQQAEIEAARRRLDAEMHRVLGLEEHPDGVATEAGRIQELSAVSNAERQRLEADEGYVRARQELVAARQKLDGIRLQLLTGDPEWVKAIDEHGDAERIERESKAEQRSSATAVTQTRELIENREQLAARARSAINQAESRLRALGAKP